jgi:hypothetical protein
MKKLFITLPILLISIGAMAQNKPVEQPKELPATLTLTMSKGEFLRIDTAVNFYIQAIDSKTQSANYLNALKSVYDQVKKQLVVKGVKKP